jgi:hypothetical protein
MFPTVRKNILTWLSLTTGVALLVIGIIVFAPSLAPAEPTITWTPAFINETILGGETKTVSVFFIASEDVNNVIVRVVPELQPYVRVSPSNFSSITRGQNLNLTIVISSLVTSLPGTFEGTIQLRSGTPSQKTIAKPLPVTINIWQRIVEPTSDVAFAIPPNLIARIAEDSVIVADPTQPNLPPLFVAYVIDVPPDLAGSPLQETLEQIALSQVGKDFIRIVSFHDGGVEMEARTFMSHHFFIYDSTTHKAVEFMAGRDDFFRSPEFVEILRLMEF